MARPITATDREVFFPKDELIVSKTDTKGRITYANKTFCDIAGFTEDELIGQPHSIVRHPDMPRAVFKVLWDTLFAGKEIFAYVKNLTKHGDYYWVFAHVTPSFNRAKQIVSFHSNRRVPDQRIVETAVAPLYATVLKAEASERNGQASLAAGVKCITDLLASKGMAYDEFIFSL